MINEKKSIINGMFDVESIHTRQVILGEDKDKQLEAVGGVDSTEGFNCVLFQ